jgi:LAO/AO transport system kinase
MLEMTQSSTGSVIHHGKSIAVDTPPDTAGSSDSDVLGWEIPVLKTVALQGEGIDAVVDTLAGHLDYLQTSNELITRNHIRLSDELHAVLQAELVQRLLEQLPPDYLSNIVTDLAEKRLTPYEAVQQILRETTIGG